MLASNSLLWTLAAGVVLVLVGTGGCRPTSDTDPSTSSTPAASVPSLPDSVLTPPDSATAARFDAVMRYGMSRRDSVASEGVLMQKVGVQFRGRPYLEGTLDTGPSESLVVRLDGFDCVTFIEATLALTRGVMAGDTTYAGFARRLAEQRYRDGTMQGYCSRLHYFTEWMANNEEKGIVERIDNTLGGRRMADTIDFMSTHRGSYDRFATNDSLYACVQAMEDSLQSQQRARPVRFVPQDSIRAVYDQLRAGDIVGIATSIDGLDIAHTGLVYAYPDGNRGFLHASLSDGVVVLPDLQRYIRKIDHQIGIVVARPAPPRYSERSSRRSVLPPTLQVNSPILVYRSPARSLTRVYAHHAGYSAPRRVHERRRCPRYERLPPRRRAHRPQQ